MISKIRFRLANLPQQLYNSDEWNLTAEEEEKGLSFFKRKELKPGFDLFFCNLMDQPLANRTVW